MAGWLHGVLVGEWLFVFPLCGFSLSLFCNYPWECAHPQLRCPQGGRIMHARRCRDSAVILTARTGFPDAEVADFNARALRVGV